MPGSTRSPPASSARAAPPSRPPSRPTSWITPSCKPTLVVSNRSPTRTRPPSMRRRGGDAAAGGELSRTFQSIIDDIVSALHHQFDTIRRKPRALGRQRLAGGGHIGALDQEHRPAGGDPQPLC